MIVLLVGLPGGLYSTVQVVQHRQEGLEDRALCPLDQLGLLAGCSLLIILEVGRGALQALVQLVPLLLELFQLLVQLLSIQSHFACFGIIGIRSA